MKIFKFLAATLIILVFLTSDFLAIPAFARKYKLSCQTCHNPFPRLKAYGDEFAGNGFKMPEMESRRYYVDTGDEQLSLIRDFPIAVRLDMHAIVKTNKFKKGLDFQSPYLLKLLSGGELADNLAYYFYFYMDERGEVVGVEDAYIMFNNLLDIDLDLYLGQFQVSDPLFKRELRLTLEDYEIYKTKVGNAAANLAYDRGLMLTLGLDTGTDIILEVVNGNGIHGADDLKNFDKDSFNNFFGRVSQSIVDFVRIGAFGYIGNEKMEGSALDYDNQEIVMWGPDITIGNDIVELNCQYLSRKDSFDDDYDVTTKGVMTELLLMPRGDESKWYLAGLYNWIDSDIGILKYHTATFHTGYLFRRNMRMVMEYKYDFELKYNTFSVGLVSAF